jgi:hypothetical protein
VIVDEDQVRGVQVQGAPDDLTRIDRDVIDGPDAEAFVRNEPVLAIELQKVKSLDIAAHRQGAIVHHGLPGGQDWVAVDVTARISRAAKMVACSCAVSSMLPERRGAKTVGCSENRDMWVSRVDPGQDRTGSEALRWRN